MRRTLILLGMLIAFSLSGCGDKGAEMNSSMDVIEESSNLSNRENQEDAVSYIKDIIWEQVEDNIVVLHFIFWDGSVLDREIVAYSVQDIVFEDITGNGVDEALIYCDFANNTCDWQLVYFYRIDQGSVTDISPSSEDIPELENADWGLWNMWIANETMGDYSSPVYKLESYYKEQGILYVEETLYIGYRDGKWELVQEF